MFMQNEFNIMEDTVGTEVNEAPIVVEEKTPKKRGRKPSAKRKGYFYEEEEAAFNAYVASNDQTFRDRIFAEKLYPAFTKMIESIIRRYGLFTPDEAFEDTFYDTMSFLITKVNNFDVSKGYKVYSYCGTVCKNYLLLKRLKAIKHIDTSIPYDTVFNENKNDRPDENIEDESSFYNDIIISMRESVERQITTQQNKLNSNELKVGYALIALLDNWETIFDSMGTKKFNKSSVILFIKDCTNLSTNEIRNAMKVYKGMYSLVKENLISE